jgi:hypothetical protein
MLSALYIRQIPLFCLLLPNFSMVDSQMKWAFFVALHISLSIFLFVQAHIQLTLASHSHLPPIFTKQCPSPLNPIAAVRVAELFF